MLFIAFFENNFVFVACYICTVGTEAVFAIKMYDGVSRVRHSGAGGCSDMQCVDTCGERTWCWQSPILGVPVEAWWAEQWGQVGAAMVLPQER